MYDLHYAFHNFLKLFFFIEIELGNVKNASRLLHSLLYTYILRNDLTAAVAFVDSLIVKASPSLEDDLDPDQMSATHDIQPSLMTFVTKTLRSQVR